MTFSIDTRKYRVVDLSYQVVPPGTADRPYVIQLGRLADNAYKFDITRTHTHVGTHVEAPAHFYLGGKDFTELPLEAFFGRGILLDVTDAAEAQRIDGAYLREKLAAVIEPGDIVVARNSDLGAEATPSFTPEAALWFRERRIKMLGVDQHFRLGPTITATRALHDILMSQDICLIEFLDNLAELRRPDLFFMALPFKCAQIDSAPARAIAIEER
ncbi:MAG: cyclase family protein [Candidatus Brocadiia bacterium]